MRLTLVLTLVAAAACGSDNSTNNDLSASGDFAAPPDLTRLGVGDAAGGCDPILQNCADATNSKCTLVPMNGTGTNVCVAPMGSQPQGATCTRSSPGMDDCAKGLFCSALATITSPPTRTCLAFCVTDADCGAGHCAPSAAVIDVGVCVPGCALFGTSCGAGNTCGAVLAGFTNQFFTCHGVGTAAIGAACGSDADCPANAACLDPAMSGAPTCLALCDGSHACAAGSCKPINPGSSDGYCQ